MNAMTFHTRKGRKAKAAPVTLPQWDRGAEGPANQPRLRVEPATFEDKETGGEVLTGGKRRRRQSWVQLYARKGELTQAQLLAAERLARAAEGFPDRDPLAAIWGGKGTDGFDPQAARVDARAEFRRLWALVPEASQPVMRRVVLEDEAIWPKSGTDQRARHIQRLRDGLEAIA